MFTEDCHVRNHPCAERIKILRSADFKYYIQNIHKNTHNTFHNNSFQIMQLFADCNKICTANIVRRGQLLSGCQRFVVWAPSLIPELVALAISLVFLSTFEVSFVVGSGSYFLLLVILSVTKPFFLGSWCIRLVLHIAVLFSACLSAIFFLDAPASAIIKIISLVFHSLSVIWWMLLTTAFIMDTCDGNSAYIRRIEEQSLSEPLLSVDSPLYDMSEKEFLGCLETIFLSTSLNHDVTYVIFSYLALRIIHDAKPEFQEAGTCLVMSMQNELDYTLDVHPVSVVTHMFHFHDLEREISAAKMRGMKVSGTFPFCCISACLRCSHDVYQGLPYY